jgi:hypothetical protein
MSILFSCKFTVQNPKTMLPHCIDGHRCPYFQGAVTSEQQFSFVPRQQQQQQQPLSLQQLQQQQQQQQPVSLQQLQQQQTAQTTFTAPAQSFLDRPALTFQDGPTGPQSPLAASFDLFPAATGQQQQGFPPPRAVPQPTAGPQFDSVPTVPAVTSLEQFRLNFNYHCLGI